MSDFVKQLPRANPVLFAMICRFNMALASDVTADRFGDEIPDHLLCHLRASPRGLRHLSRVLAVRHRLTPDGFYDFEPRHRRMALLSGPCLSTLARYTTAAVLRPEIARLVTRPERDEVKKMLGDDAYMFAIKRAEFLAGPLTKELETARLLADVLRNPFWCLEQSFAGEPAELTGRMCLKLLRSATMEFSESRSPGQAELRQLMSRILLSEIAPELKPCFN